jgi:hypothetical protein
VPVAIRESYGAAGFIGVRCRGKLGGKREKRETEEVPWKNMQAYVGPSSLMGASGRGDLVVTAVTRPREVSVRDSWLSSVKPLQIEVKEKMAQGADDYIFQRSRVRSESDAIAIL